MATRMTVNGVSTCTEAGTEKYERFQSGIGRRKRTLVQYDYRHPFGRRVVLLCQTHVGRVPSRTGQVAYGKRREGGQTDERSLPNADSEVQRAYQSIGRHL